MATNTAIPEIEQHISETQIRLQRLSDIGIRNLSSTVPFGALIGPSSNELSGSSLALNAQRPTPQNPSLPSDVSIRSCDSSGNSCRICRCHKNEEEIIQCPCICTGSVGFVHLKCLKRWILYRDQSVCEICQHRFNLPKEKRDYRVMLRSFFRPMYFGSLLKHTMNLCLVTPMAYFTLHQLVSALDYLEAEKHFFKILLVGPTMLFATCFYLFLYFDWAITTVLKIKNIFRHWWKFGDQVDDDPNSFLSLDESGFFEFDWMYL